MKILEIREKERAIDLNVEQICAIEIYEEYVTLRMSDGTHYDLRDRRTVDRLYAHTQRTPWVFPTPMAAGEDRPRPPLHDDQ